MDDDDFIDEDDLEELGALSKCSRCGNPFLEVIKRKQGMQGELCCEMEETLKCGECGKLFKQHWFGQGWEEADKEEKSTRLIILDNGAEVVIGKNKEDIAEGEDDPEDWRT